MSSQLKTGHSSHTVGMHPGASETPTMSNSQTEPDAVTSNERFPQRKNIRAAFHNYSGGDYFVTICTQDKRHYFGEICHGEMCFSEIGAVAHKALKILSTHYSYVDVPLFVVMPNHIHAIISIRKSVDSPGHCGGADAPGCIPTVRTALGVVVGGYKQSVTMFARRNDIEFGWQSRFHDHIIRGATDGNKIADYIADNVMRWDTDCYRE